MGATACRSPVASIRPAIGCRSNAEGRAARADYVSGMAARKEAQLREWLGEQARIAIGYSGGVDSAYLAAVALGALGPDNVLAVTGRSASYPESQWIAARETARAIGLVVLEIDTAELDDPRYAANPTNRCYFCKSELWSHVVPAAEARGIHVIADGTNADDLNDHR